MASFEDLPVEITDRICLHLRKLILERRLDSNNDVYLAARRALASLCCTSKKLYTIALPYLYYSIDIGLRGANLNPSTRTFLEQQRFASFVHELNVEDLDTPERDYKSRKRYITSLDAYWGLARTAFNDMAFDRDVGDLIEFRKRDDLCALPVLYLLLTRLCNLRFFYLSFYRDYSMDECWQLIADRHRKESSFLPQIRNVVLDSLEIDIVVHFGLFRSFLHGAQVERLCIPFGLYIPRGYGESLPSVRELRLLAEVCTNPGFVDLAKCFPNLELFQYEALDGDRQNREGAFHASIAKMAHGLYPLRNSLHTLILHHDVGHAARIEGPSGSLADFGKLRNLMVSLFFTKETFVRKPVMGDLPRSIENLCLMGIETRHAKGLCCWIDEVKDELSNLKTFIVDAPLHLVTYFAETDVHLQEVEFMSLKAMKADEGRKWERLLATAGYEL